MKNSLYLFLSAFFVFQAGCFSTKQMHEPSVAKKEAPAMVRIQNLTVTDADLTLDYQISNPFDYAIWVCYDGSVRVNKEFQSVSATIDDARVRLQLRCNVKGIGGFVDPPTVAKYVRLLPGESYSGRIRRRLPLRDYVREWRAERKEHKNIVSHRAVFEVGYFGPRLNFDSWSERSKKEPDKYKPNVVGPYYIMSGTPFITEESLDGKLHEVMYTEKLSFITEEEYTEVLITDVDIPCTVIVGDE